MSQPISFTVKPPTTLAPYRPSPLGNGSARGAPSRRLFEQNGHDEESDEEEYHGGSRKTSKPKDERIEGFGNGRALGYVDSPLLSNSQPSKELMKEGGFYLFSGEKPAGPLVIPALPNKDWRAHSSSNRVPSYRPETRDPNETVETHERTGDGPQRSGLRKVETSNSNGLSSVQVKRESVVEEDVKPDINIKEEPNGNIKDEEDVKGEPLSLDKQALQAILQGEVKMESEEERLRRELVIGGPNHISEEEALKRDIDELPDMVSPPASSLRRDGADQADMNIGTKSTAEDYAAIPVSAFGEAMARGMGWNPSSSGGTKIHEPKLRPALLGLGATALVEKPAPPSRNGTSSSSKKPKVNKRDSMKYNLGNSLIKRERGDGSSGASTPLNGSSRRTSPESDGSVKRRREEDYDKDRSREKSTRYETDEERARRKAKEREREYETDEERARRKAKERERYDRDRRDRDRDERDRRDRYHGDRRDRDRDDRDRRDRYDRDEDRRRDR
uniref:Spp2/MOS2 G-patch domain-containing protein n=1 Tax=Kwoniella bestiolae CBS 10118 TaxID=1296100 RepID=A0A1B9GG24_9TREE|nr:hypothetical protein I302_01496 [Kwoniella bestiolae CBS 10118]OCF29979.1 hypothetical protein I302_01496 [Kwoniella bestiolae CBS 10118]